MADTSFDDVTRQSPTRPEPTTEVSSVSPVRSDVGTIILHWLTVVSMIVSLLTGLRISADGLGRTWAAALAPVLPQGEIWTWHILAGLTLTASAIAYFVYVRRAALFSRNAPARLRTIRPPTNQKLRWRAINVALHWFAYASIAVLTVTGIVLYLGHSSIFLLLHNWFAWAMLAYIAIHTVAHALYGGIAQLLRLFRPQPVVETAHTKIWPLGIALFAASVTAVFAITADWSTRSTITALNVNTPPTLDGLLDEPIWEKAERTTIDTHQGANLGGSGESAASMQSVIHDGRIYFAFRWEDPTRSLMRSPVTKREDGWYVISSGGAEADVNDYYEDKFAVLFSLDDQLGGGGSTFLGKDPCPITPNHLTGAGSITRMTGGIWIFGSGNPAGAV